MCIPFFSELHIGECIIPPPPIGKDDDDTTTMLLARTTPPTDNDDDDDGLPTTTTSPPLMSSLPCLEDVTLVKKYGFTNFPQSLVTAGGDDIMDGSVVEIISQDTSTVTVTLNQYWTTIDVDHDSIYYKFKESRISNVCYEQTKVNGGGTSFDTITITCNLLSPIAYLRICIVDDLSNGNLSSQDDATVPKCCHSSPEIPTDTPTVCYALEIRCESRVCIDDEAVVKRRSMLRQ